MIEAARRYVARRRENSANIRAQNEAINTRIRDNPTVRDIEMGDALNAAVNQLTDPRVSSAALRLATCSHRSENHPGNRVSQCRLGGRHRAEPDQNGDQVADCTRTPRFAEEKRTFEAIVDRAIREDEEGEVSADTLKFGSQPRQWSAARLAAEPLEGVKPREDANRFIKTLAGLVRLLERPDTTDGI